MAISKILHINPHMNSNGYHLKVGLNYIVNKEKTEDGLYVGAVNCSLSDPYGCMKSTKVAYGKTDKRQAYHLIISFEEGETDAETAFEIAREFTEKYLSENYEAVYSVHNDTDHIHCHIIWNSVRFTDGYKYRYEKGDWERYIQPLVDSICESHGLGTLDKSKKEVCDIMSQSQDDKEWDVYKNGPFVWNEQIKRDVDACIIAAADFDMFVQLLEEKDYQVKMGKYISVKPKGMERFRRLKTLGAEYSEDRIRQRIVKESITHYRRAGIPTAPRIKGYRGRIKKRKLTGLQKQYFALLYRLGKIKKRSYSNNYKYREDIRKLKLLQKQYLFLSNYNVKTEQDLSKVQQSLKARIKTTNKAKAVLETENEKYQDLFDAVNTIKKEKQAATFYKLGDKTFHKQNEAVENAKAVLNATGLTFKEAEKITNHYKDLIDECDREIKKLKAELRTSYGLAKDIQRRKERDEELAKQRTETEEKKDKQQIKKKSL